MKVYLAGPINGCTDTECNDWRQEFIEKYDGEYLNPMVRDYRGREAECFSDIVEDDKSDIKCSDVLLVMFEKPSVGTSMEVLFAWQLGKKVIIVDRSNRPLSPWLKYHSDMVVTSLDEAIHAITVFKALTKPAIPLWGRTATIPE